MDTETVLALSSQPGWFVSGMVALDNGQSNIVSALLQKLAVCPMGHIHMAQADAPITLYEERLAERKQVYVKHCQHWQHKKRGKSPYGSNFGHCGLDKGEGDDVDYSSPKWRHYEASNKRMHAVDYDCAPEHEPYDPIKSGDFQDREEYAMYGGVHSVGFLVEQLFNEKEQLWHAIKAAKLELVCIEAEINEMDNVLMSYNTLTTDILALPCDETRHKLYDIVRNKADEYNQHMHSLQSLQEERKADIKHNQKELDDVDYKINTLLHGPSWLYQIGFNPLDYKVTVYSGTNQKQRKHEQKGMLWLNALYAPDRILHNYAKRMTSTP